MCSIGITSVAGIIGTRVYKFALEIQVPPWSFSEIDQLRWALELTKQAKHEVLCCFYAHSVLGIQGTRFTKLLLYILHIIKLRSIEIFLHWEIFAHLPNYCRDDDDDAAVCLAAQCAVGIGLIVVDAEARHHHRCQLQLQRPHPLQHPLNWAAGRVVYCVARELLVASDARWPVDTMDHRLCHRTR